MLQCYFICGSDGEKTKLTVNGIGMQLRMADSRCAETIA
jgi:hypothetical protein